MFSHASISQWIRYVSSSHFASKACIRGQTVFNSNYFCCRGTGTTSNRRKFTESSKLRAKGHFNKRSTPQPELRTNKRRVYVSSVPELPKASTLSEVIKPIGVNLGRTEGPNIGQQLTDKLDEEKLANVLQDVSSAPDVCEILQQALSIDKVMQQNILTSFCSYCKSKEALPVNLHVKLHDLTQDGGSRTDLLPYILEHAHKMYPHLVIMDDLRQLCVTTMVDPVHWYPETRRMKRTIIYHSGPTNSGKTYAALQSFRKAESGIYLAPLRLLAIECFSKTNEKDVPCDLLTGERKYFINGEDNPANHKSCTIELLDFNAKYDVAVIDEIQMIGDLTRGGNWTLSLLGVMAKEIHVCGDASALQIVESLVRQCGDSFKVKHYRRKTPLEIQNKPLDSLANVKAGDCIVCFQVKQLFTVGEELKRLGHSCALIYGALPPGIKIHQTDMFNHPDNNCNILVATDAIGMGLNLEIQRIIFHDASKLTLVENEGELVDRFSREKKPLSTSQALQIAGRAGRYGRSYTKGEVTALHKKDLDVITEVLNQPVPKIKKAGLTVRDDIVETFAYYLPGMQFSRILMLYIAMTETDQQYFMCDLSPWVKNAMLTDHIEMQLKDKLTFCQAPLRHNISSMGIAVYVQMARRISTGIPITLEAFLEISRFDESELIEIKQFEVALEIFHLTDIFLWLSSRFTAIQTVERMRTFRFKLDKALRKYIESNYTNINKGIILKFSSPDLKGLIAYKETSNQKTDKQNMDKLQLKKNVLIEKMESLLESDQGLNINGEGDGEAKTLTATGSTVKTKNGEGQHTESDYLSKVWYTPVIGQVAKAGDTSSYDSESDSIASIADNAVDRSTLSTRSKYAGDSTSRNRKSDNKDVNVTSKSDVGKRQGTTRSTYVDNNVISKSAVGRTKETIQSYYEDINVKSKSAVSRRQGNIRSTYEDNNVKSKSAVSRTKGTIQSYYEESYEKSKSDGGSIKTSQSDNEDDKVRPISDHLSMKGALKLIRGIKARSSAKERKAKEQSDQGIQANQAVLQSTGTEYSSTAQITAKKNTQGLGQSNKHFSPNRDIHHTPEMPSTLQTNVTETKPVPFIPTEKRMEGLRQYMKRTGLDIREAAKQWKNLSQAEQDRYM